MWGFAKAVAFRRQFPQDNLYENRALSPVLLLCANFRGTLQRHALFRPERVQRRINGCSPCILSHCLGAAGL